MQTAARTQLIDLPTLSKDDFVARLGAVYEHSPWIAERAWQAGPYTTVGAVHEALVAVVAGARRDEQLALIRAHPELAGSEAAAGTLTAASGAEQQGAGLDRCSAGELARLRALNAAYRARFGFPFVIAVKGLSRYQVMDAIEERLRNEADTEFHTALAEIGKIARFRLDTLFAA